jgi:hypothetical protein
MWCNGIAGPLAAVRELRELARMERQSAGVAVLPPGSLNTRRDAVRFMSDRKRAALWLVSLALGVAVLGLSFALVRRQGIDLWTWLADVWVLIAAIPPQFVIVACMLKGTEVALNAVAWAVVLRAAYPEEEIGFRQTLGVIQGGVGIFALIPPKFGGFALLGLYRAAFPTLGLPVLLATRVIQGFASTLLGTTVLLLFGVTQAGIGEETGFLPAIVAFYGERTALAILLTVVGAGLAVILVHRGREWLRGFATQIAVGGAILRSPRRYVLLVALPTLLAFVLRWGVTGTLLAAFGVPVSLDTLLRVNVSHGLARSVQIAPGGIGTTQAFDLVALQGIAPVEVIAAYSLSQSAILLVFNIAFGLIAVTWAFGWERTTRLMRFPWRSVKALPAPSSPPAGAG